MDLIGYGIKKPITVAVCVILIVMFGFIGLKKLPVQLTPWVVRTRLSCWKRLR